MIPLNYSRVDTLSEENGIRITRHRALELAPIHCNDDPEKMAAQFLQSVENPTGAFRPEFDIVVVAYMEDYEYSWAVASMGHGRNISVQSGDPDKILEALIDKAINSDKKD